MTTLELRQKEAQLEETECTSKKEVLAGIDAGLKDVLAGRTRPATELLEELLRKNGQK